MFDTKCRGVPTFARQTIARQTIERQTTARPTKNNQLNKKCFINQIQCSQIGGCPDSSSLDISSPRQKLADKNSPDKSSPDKSSPRQKLTYTNKYRGYIF